MFHSGIYICTVFKLSKTKIGRIKDSLEKRKNMCIVYIYMAFLILLKNFCDSIYDVISINIISDIPKMSMHDDDQMLADTADGLGGEELDYEGEMDVGTEADIQDEEPQHQDEVGLILPFLLHFICSS